MEITYRLCPKDLGAFADHQRSISPKTRQADRNTLLSVFLVWSFCGWTLWLATRAVALAVAWLLLGLIALLLAPIGLKGTRRKQTIALYAEEKNRWIFEPATLRIEDQGLVSETVCGTNLLKWEYVDRVCRTERYVFVYLNELQAWILPDQGIVKGDYDLFTREVEERWRAGLTAAKSKRIDAVHS